MWLLLLVVRLSESEAAVPRPRPATSEEDAFFFSHAAEHVPPASGTTSLRLLSLTCPPPPPARLDHPTLPLLCIYHRQLFVNVLQVKIHHCSLSSTISWL